MNANPLPLEGSSVSAQLSRGKIRRFYQLYGLSANSAATCRMNASVACDVPVYLTPEEIGYYKSEGFFVTLPEPPQADHGAHQCGPSQKQFHPLAAGLQAEGSPYRPGETEAEIIGQGTGVACALELLQDRCLRTVLRRQELRDN